MVAAADEELVRLEVVLIAIDELLLVVKELDGDGVAEGGTDAEFEPPRIPEDEDDAGLLLDDGTWLNEDVIVFWLAELLGTREDAGENTEDELATDRLDAGRLDEIAEFIVEDRLEDDEMLGEADKMFEVDELDERVKFDEVERLCEELDPVDALGTMETLDDAFSERTTDIDELAVKDCPGLVEAVTFCDTVDATVDKEGDTEVDV
jgi:hypothetical protein